METNIYIELDTGYGAQFDRDIELIPDGTVKLRPLMDIKSSLISFFFNEAYSLEIKLATKDRIKSFQAEDFKTEEIKVLYKGIEYYPVRYILAEYDLDNKYFGHFDGVIHLHGDRIL